MTAVAVNVNSFRPGTIEDPRVSRAPAAVASDRVDAHVAGRSCNKISARAWLPEDLFLTLYRRDARLAEYRRSRYRSKHVHSPISFFFFLSLVSCQFRVRLIRTIAKLRVSLRYTIAAPL